MEMDDYKPNSHKFKEAQADTSKNPEKKKVEKVVNGMVKVKKKNEMSKLKDVFISEDVANVKSYILMDVLVPAIKKAVSDIVTNGIDMILYGGNGRSKSQSGATKVSYRNYYDRRDYDRPAPAPRMTPGYGFADITVTNRGEAEEVIDRLRELVELYGIASVADLNELVGIQGNYTDNRYGWTSLNTAEAIRVHDGYLLKLPKPQPIN